MSVSAFFGESLDAESANLLAQVAADVAAVEAELQARTKSASPVVEEVGKHTLAAGGKRLRPAFVSLAARAIGTEYDSARIALLGACMEMIHMATLVHDDVIDHSATRRGKATAGAMFGGTAAILAGDALLAKAMTMLAEDGDLRIIRAVAKSVEEMAEGEVMELGARFEFDLSEADHLEILRKKTAAFIQTCLEVGGLVAGAGEKELDALRRYGEAVGMAFQIVDDLLDYRGDGAKVGKPKAIDFREGCATLPLIYLRPMLTDHEREVAKMKFGSGVTDDELSMISEWMRLRGAFAQAESLAQEYLEEAQRALEDLAQSPTLDLLAAAALMAVRRES